MIERATRETDPIEIAVALGERSYPIRIGAGLLGDSRWLRDWIGARQALIVSNTRVAPLYLDRLEASLAGLAVSHAILPDGEQYKTLDSAARIFAALAEHGAQRDVTILALGGGVIGDLAGFAAACWMRGVPFVQVPTTLLAMVDSSVGGKTGVNLAAGKNLVGAFHQPRGVLIDIETLATLPDREYRAGLAEVVKVAAIGDAALFAWLEAQTGALRAREAGALVEAIAASCRHKAGVVARDEREHGERALLNFGHTFGHALEAETGYTALLHGEAVAIGMCQAARLSSALGMADAIDAQRLTALLDALGLPTRAPARLDPQRLLARMRLDKKALGGHLRLILWRAIGAAEISAAAGDDAILAVLAA